jgi:hypothetical protein
MSRLAAEFFFAIIIPTRASTLMPCHKPRALIVRRKIASHTLADQKDDTKLIASNKSEGKKPRIEATEKNNPNKTTRPAI